MNRVKSIGGNAGGALGGSYAPNVATPLGNFPGAPRSDWRRRREETKAVMPTSDKDSEADLRAIRKLRHAIVTLRHTVDRDDAALARKGRYTAAERRHVRAEKRREYGTDEVFAVPNVNAYPLTQDGRPDEERVRAAWSYIHQRKNAGKLGDAETRTAEEKIRRFAKKHFPKLVLESSAKSLCVGDALKHAAANPLDASLAVIYGAVPVIDAVADVHQYLDETSNTRDHETLLHRAHLMGVLDRLVELADRGGVLD